MPYEPMTPAEKEHLGWMALALRNALLVGDQAPVVAAMWKRHQNPEPGDWVIETTTLYRLVRYPERLTDDERRSLWDGQFSRFLRSEIRTHGEGDDEWSEQVWICENPDGTEYAWTNADLAAVPLDAPLA